MAKEQPPRVLVVEDNEVNQAWPSPFSPGSDLALSLTHGQQAVELVARGCYALVLMDCQLPVLDGYRATAEIRRREGSARRTPIIALTAAVLEDRQRCLAAGMDDHIAKPVLLAEVQEVLSRWLAAEVTIRQVAGPALAAESTWEVLEKRRLAELGWLEHRGRPAGRRTHRVLVGPYSGDLADLRPRPARLCGCVSVAHALRVRTVGAVALSPVRLTGVARTRRTLPPILTPHLLDRVRPHVRLWSRRPRRRRGPGDDEPSPYGIQVQFVDASGWFG